jgi:hypothetical protein
MSVQKFPAVLELNLEDGQFVASVRLACPTDCDCEVEADPNAGGYKYCKNVTLLDSYEYDLDGTALDVTLAVETTQDYWSGEWDMILWLENKS